MIYRISNITHTLDKKHPSYNKQICFNYKDRQITESMKVGPHGTVYLKVQEIPQDVRVLAANGLIKCESINEQQYLNDIMQSNLRQNIAKKKQ